MQTGILVIDKFFEMYVIGKKKKTKTNSKGKKKKNKGKLGWDVARLMG